MLKMIWKGCTMCRWTGFLGEKESEEQVSAGHTRNETQKDVSDAGSEKRN